MHSLPSSRALAKFIAPLLIAAAAVTAPALESAGATPASVAASAAPATGMSFVGPVIPIDMVPATKIFAGGLYRDPSSAASTATARLRGAGQLESAALLGQIGDQPTAIWLGDWYTVGQLETHLDRHVAAATKQKTTPVFVTYAIPNRDCGGHSAGGLSPSAYLDWNRAIASALADTDAVILVEPDALAMLTGGQCAGEKERRLDTMSQAVDILAGAGLTLYLDAGHSDWTSPQEMAALLREAGVFEARGFVSNVSNFRRVEQERVYDDALSKELGGKSYLIDVSRNGNGPQGEWCNPSGASIGQSPRIADGTTKLDALLWVKQPGESDGNCNGGPTAGQWWESYALDLVRNRKG